MKKLIVFTLIFFILLSLISLQTFGATTNDTIQIKVIFQLNSTCGDATKDCWIVGDFSNWKINDGIGGVLLTKTNSNATSYSGSKIFNVRLNKATSSYSLPIEYKLANGLSGQITQLESGTSNRKLNISHSSSIDQMNVTILQWSAINLGEVIFSSTDNIVKATSDFDLLALTEWGYKNVSKSSLFVNNAFSCVSFGVKCRLWNIYQNDLKQENELFKLFIESKQPLATDCDPKVECSLFSRFLRWDQNTDYNPYQYLNHWKVIDSLVSGITSDGSGFAMKAFEKIDQLGQGTGEVVVVARGTESVEDYLADIALVVSIENSQSLIFQTYFNPNKMSLKTLNLTKFGDELRKTNPKSITLVGHSLGGHLVLRAMDDACTAFKSLCDQNKIKGVTYNAPGGSYSTQEQNMKNLVINYSTEGDLVSDAGIGDRYGKIIKYPRFDLFNGFGNYINQGINTPKNTEIFDLPALGTHSLSNFYGLIDYNSSNFYDINNNLDVYGTKKNDFMASFAKTTKNTLRGLDGNDIIQGNNVFDVLNGGEGNDILMVDGGNGDQTYTIPPTLGHEIYDGDVNTDGNDLMLGFIPSKHISSNFWSKYSYNFTKFYSNRGNDTIVISSLNDKITIDIGNNDILQDVSLFYSQVKQDVFPVEKLFFRIKDRIVTIILHPNFEDIKASQTQANNPKNLMKLIENDGIYLKNNKGSFSLKTYSPFSGIWSSFTSNQSLQIDKLIDMASKNNMITGLKKPEKIYLVYPDYRNVNVVAVNKIPTTSPIETVDQTYQTSLFSNSLSIREYSQYNNITNYGLSNLYWNDFDWNSFSFISKNSSDISFRIKNSNPMLWAFDANNQQIKVNALAYPAFSIPFVSTIKEFKEVPIQSKKIRISFSTNLYSPNLKVVGDFNGWNASTGIPVIQNGAVSGGIYKYFAEFTSPGYNFPYKFIQMTNATSFKYEIYTGNRYCQPNNLLLSSECIVPAAPKF